MSDIPSDAREEAEAEIALEVELDARPEKVWRAIAIPAFREPWLPGADLAEPEPVASVPGVEVCYRMREDGAPSPKAPSHSGSNPARRAAPCSGSFTGSRAILAERAPTTTFAP